MSAPNFRNLHLPVSTYHPDKMQAGPTLTVKLLKVIVTLTLKTIDFNRDPLHPKFENPRSNLYLVIIGQDVSWTDRHVQMGA